MSIYLYLAWLPAFTAVVMGQTSESQAHAAITLSTIASHQERAAVGKEVQPQTAGGWRKYPNNPVLGGKYGTCFDVSVLKEGDTYRMWVSWRPKQSVGLVESKDGFTWSEPPRIALGPKKET